MEVTPQVTKSKLECERSACFTEGVLHLLDIHAMRAQSRLHEYATAGLLVGLEGKKPRWLVGQVRPCPFILAIAPVSYGTFIQL